MEDKSAPAQSDAALGIISIRQRPGADGRVVVKADRETALAHRDEYLKRIDEIIDQNISQTTGSFLDLFPISTQESVDQVRASLKNEIRRALDLPGSSATRLGPVGVILIDGQETLTGWFNEAATANEEFGQNILNSLPENSEGNFIAWLEQHEMGHMNRTDGNVLGLADPGADYYAAMQFLKKKPEAREELRAINDARVYYVMNPDHDKDSDKRDIKHGFGTYFAAGEAMKLSPEEIRLMDDDEIVERAAKFDSFAERQQAAEYDVKNDILNEMQDMKHKTGEMPTLKQAVDSLIRRDIYATDGRIVGDSDAIKYKTLNEFSHALDRLEKRGITSPFEEKYAQLLEQNQLQEAASTPARQDPRM